MSGTGNEAAIAVWLHVSGYEVPVSKEGIVSLETRQDCFPTSINGIHRREKHEVNVVRMSASSQRWCRVL